MNVIASNSGSLIYHGISTSMDNTKSDQLKAWTKILKIVGKLGFSDGLIYPVLSNSLYYTKSGQQSSWR